MKKIIPVLALLAGCAEQAPPIPSAPPAAQTAPVGSPEDAADDAAIWVNDASPEASFILGTDKKAGLYVYGLDGAVKQFLEVGALNNVDLRQGVRIGDWAGDLAAASNRSDNSITLFSVGESGAAALGSFPSALIEPYGLCMGVVDGEVLIVVGYKTGDLIAYRPTGPLAAEEAGRIKLASQLEGCVFDDAAGALYVGEENRGLWRVALQDGAFSEAKLVDEVGGESGIVADVEGVTLYAPDETSGYLVVSSQGNNSYAVYERGGQNAFVGRFAIGQSGEIDSVQETDGVAASAAMLGTAFPRGVLVVQDGQRPRGLAQNFKIVDWRAIEAALGL